MFDKVIGVGILVFMIIILFPDVKLGYDAFIGVILAECGITEGFVYLVFITLPYWALGALIFRLARIMFRGDRSSNMRL